MCVCVIEEVIAKVIIAIEKVLVIVIVIITKITEVVGNCNDYSLKVIVTSLVSMDF